jgi:hypothetical protein
LTENPRASGDLQCRVSGAEILATVLVATLKFGGCFKLVYRFLHQHGDVIIALSPCRFVRCLHRCEPLISSLCHVLASLAHKTNAAALCIIDSFALSVCDNIRIRRAYQASKRRYFYRLTTHLMVTSEGQPVVFLLSPGSLSDTTALKRYAFEISNGATITGDKAYNDDQYEDLLAGPIGIW